MTSGSYLLAIFLPENINIMAENIYATKDVKLIAANVIILFLSPTAVVLRLLSRRIAAVRFGWDDYTIIVAMVMAGSLPIISFIGKPI